ncbi:MAG: dynamin family protein, partial [Limisphaerales bacterium]
EWETEQKAAHEKFTSVYRQEPPDDLTPFIEHATLSLPDNIASAMSLAKPIVIVEENALTLRNKVRRYLVGREQHADGQFWPLISRVRVYGNFPVLANGVVLVDLPGLNDPNPAREQVTKRYLDQARYVWLICNSQTGIDRVFTQLLRDNALLYKLYMEGRLDAFSVITTRIDDINLAAILEQMGVNPDDFDGDHTGILDFRRQEINNHVKSNLLEIAHDIASRAEHSSVREDFFRRVQAVPVFPVSTNTLTTDV